MFKFLDFIHIPKEPEVEIYRPKPEQDENYGDAIEPPEEEIENPEADMAAEDGDCVKIMLGIHARININLRGLL
jgi:hypothetical protein